MLIDKALNRGYVLSPLAAPHHRREGLVFHRPSNKGQAIEALSRRRSRQDKLALSAIVGVDDRAGGRDAIALAKELVRRKRELAAQHGARVSAFEAVSLPAYLFEGPAAPVEESNTSSSRTLYMEPEGLGYSPPKAMIPATSSVERIPIGCPVSAGCSVQARAHAPSYEVEVGHDAPHRGVV